MRFDDSLATVLAADARSPVGAGIAWRQLVDLIGRRRVEDVDAAVERLRELRERVSPAVRGDSARALATAHPPATLVAFFAEDTLPVAASVLRTVQLNAPEWLALLPALSPPARSVLRHRRDLPADVVRGLASFGATDFVLGHDAPPVAPLAKPIWPSKPAHDVAPRSDIADLVARIDAFRRDRPAPAVPAAPPRPDHFQFHTDTAGVIRWVEGVARTALIGIDLCGRERQGLVTLAAQAGEAFVAHRAFRDVQLDIDGGSSAAGRWRIAGEPRFEHGSGRILGYGGTARRVVEIVPAETASDTLRQLVHELRTPANAMVGFAELIGTELLAPVAPPYRDRAALIQLEARGLTEAIDDLDIAARIEGDALPLRPGCVDLVPLVTRTVADLRLAAAARDIELELQVPRQAAALADDRAARRLPERLIAAVLAAAGPRERLRIQLVAKSRSVRLHVTRPRALVALDDDALLAIAAGEGGDEALPLGVGFTLRLVRSFAAAQGGSLTITAERLTLRLPAAVTPAMERATAA